jgi:hypothetical protein
MYTHVFIEDMTFCPLVYKYHIIESCKKIIPIKYFVQNEKAVEIAEPLSACK